MLPKQGNRPSEQRATAPCGTQVYDSERNLPQLDKRLALGQHLCKRYCSLLADVVVVEAARERGKQVSHPVQVHVSARVTAPNVAHGLLLLLCALEGGQVGHLHDRLGDNLGSLHIEFIASKAGRKVAHVRQPHDRT